MTKKKEPAKAGDLGTVIDRLGLLKDSVLAGDLMGVYDNLKAIGEQFMLALYPPAPVPMAQFEGKFRHVAFAPCECDTKEELADKVEMCKSLAEAGGNWVAMFAKLLPILLALLQGA